MFDEKPAPPFVIFAELKILPNLGVKFRQRDLWINKLVVHDFSTANSGLQIQEELSTGLEVEILDLLLDIQLNT